MRRVVRGIDNQAQEDTVAGVTDSEVRVNEGGNVEARQATLKWLERREVRRARWRWCEIARSKSRESVK